MIFQIAYLNPRCKRLKNSVDVFQVIFKTLCLKPLHVLSQKYLACKVTKAEWMNTRASLTEVH